MWSEDFIWQVVSERQRAMHEGRRTAPRKTRLRRVHDLLRSALHS